MAKAKVASEPKERPYNTTSDLWEILNKVAFERSRTSDGLVNEKDLKTLELELGKPGH
jgi:hypothetical protein